MSVAVDYSDPLQEALIDHRLGPGSIGQLSDEQVRRISDLRESARLFARHVAVACPNSYERDNAIQDIDNAASWAARAIARHE